jgi:hypothetical protein
VAGTPAVASALLDQAAYCQREPLACYRLPSRCDDGWEGRVVSIGGVRQRVISLEVWLPSARLGGADGSTGRPVLPFSEGWIPESVPVVAQNDGQMTY